MHRGGRMMHGGGGGGGGYEEEEWFYYNATPKDKIWLKYWWKFNFFIII